MTVSFYIPLPSAHLRIDFDRCLLRPYASGWRTPHLVFDRRLTPGDSSQQRQRYVGVGPIRLTLVTRLYEAQRRLEELELTPVQAARDAIRKADGKEQERRGCSHPIEPNGHSCTRCGRPAWVSP
jgi:hypothetical protein